MKNKLKLVGGLDVTTLTVPLTSTLPVPEFRWRDRHGNFHRLQEMSTHHLFHVIRMIWDHAMPPEAHTTFRKRYNFPEFYTQDYIATTIRLGLPQLFVRPDLEPYMQFWLDHMAWYLRNRQQIAFVKRIGYIPKLGRK